MKYRMEIPVATLCKILETWINDNADDYKTNPSLRGVVVGVGWHASGILSVTVSDPDEVEGEGS